jgi:hypothetical protein
MGGVDIHPSQLVLVVYTDASLEWWGAHCTHHTPHGLWSEQEQSLHINILELQTVFLALKTFAKFIIIKPVQVATDNTTVVAYINQQGGTHSWELCALLWRILTWCHQRGVLLTCRYIPGCLNFIADTLSRRGQALNTEWSLHPRFNNKLLLFVSPEPDPKALHVDSISMDWTGKYMYLFPPLACIP